MKKFLQSLFFLSFPLHCLQAATVENVCFSPGQSCSEMIHNYIENTDDYIFVSMYTFTDGDIAQRIVNTRNTKHLPVVVFVDAKQFADTTPYSTVVRDKLWSAGIPMYGIQKDEGIFHQKVLLVGDGDRRIAVTGSYNFTKSAYRINNENMVFINGLDISGRYIDMFWNQVGDVAKLKRYVFSSFLAKFS